MKHMSKAIALILALVLLAALFAGCGKEQADPSAAADPAPPAADTAGDDVANAIQEEGNSLSIWLYESFSDAANEATMARIEQFEEDYNVEIEYEWVTDQNYTTKYNAGVEAGVLPDVTYMRSDILLSTYPNIKLADLSGLINELNAEAGFVQSFVDGGTINGASYIVPSFSSAQPVVYRKDLFAEAGYETFPASWEDLRDACIKISELHPDIAGFGIGFGINENEGEQVFRSMMWDYGGGLFDAEGNISADCPENAEALQLYVDMWNAGALPADAASWDAGSNNANYMQETVAMTCNAYTILSALAEPGYEALNKNTGVAMRPAGPAGSHNDICTYGWGIFADTEAMETAQAFLRYMSEPTWYAGWIEELAPVYGPTLVSVVESPYWQAEPGSILVEFGKNGAPFGYPATDVETRAKAAQVFNSYKLNECMSNIIVGGMSVEEGLAWLQAEMEAMFS
ncbi:MAG: extracellular solute-binding protein [Oscillospiraceae bacterium]|nr:extracellular solute-binding protein [Oscillospiraceae bacterium]